MAKKVTENKDLIKLGKEASKNSNFVIYLPKEEIMKLFQLGWSWYEDYESYLFVHPDKNKDEKDFEKDARSLYKKATLNIIEKSKKDEYFSYIGMNDITEEVAQILPELGYIKVEPISFETFGGYILRKDLSDTDEKELGLEFLGKELLSEVYKFNKAIDDRSKKRDKLDLKDKPKLP